ncbi:hypothetical protein C823_001224 [Eubacterium plexicaudatum ASF492]|uniref:Uncharacterized protein n=1 Tax=Eubacterium plexicaudatum ASF492 TaxID=1235802 RepID=N2B9V9_9FIRM|nr:hypothetical protein C823_001224 [Eubacterium plexicaudatum ASF492]
MILLGVLLAGIIIVWIAAWIFVIADTTECSKCDQRYLCMHSTLNSMIRCRIYGKR